MKDLEDVPRELLKRITVHPVHHYDELPPLVFETQGKRGGGEKHGLTEKTSPAPRKKSPTRPGRRGHGRRGRAERPAEA